LNQFIINNTRVDIDRCRLYRSGESIALEPRVIQVLHFLARHQGEVVSHQTLLNAIWTNTVVEPSALQRCIAQLRKAFGDDARQQHTIATYPKKGYSLVAEVSELPRQHGAQARDKEHIPPPPLEKFKPALAAGFLMGFLLLAGIMVLGPQNPQTGDSFAGAVPAPSLLANPTLLAAIENPDEFPMYSPDGRFVIYPRYLTGRRATLWARDLAYGNDFLLTDEAGIYEYLAWSVDGSRLVFVDNTCHGGACETGQCSSLKSLAISQSETNAPVVQKLIDCTDLRLLSPQWLGAGKIALIEVDDGQASLMLYDLKTSERESLYENPEFIPYHLSYSRQTRTLTIMAFNREGRKVLLFLDTATGKVNSNNTAAFVPDDNWYPSASPY